MSKISSGYIGVNRKGSKFKVIEYVNCRNVKVEFLDENKHVARTSAQSVREGAVSNPFDRTCCGVGYLGEGKYKTSENGVKDKAHTVWTSILKRCYTRGSENKKSNYLGCTVHEEWHNFQNFADWFYKQRGWNKGFHLDKDIIKKGNGQYGSDTCCLVPRCINNIVKGDYATGGKLPRGVSMSHHGKYLVSLSIDGIRTHIGLYENKEDAQQAYVTAKERYVKNKALEWANEIEWRAFKALMEWTV